MSTLLAILLVAASLFVLNRQAALTAGAWEDERSSVVPGGNAGELGLANVEEDRRAPGEATEHPANRGSSSLTAPAVSVVPCGRPPARTAA